MTQSALASVLTGRYPKEHGVRDNGKDYLSEKLDTAAEKALEKSYRTAFFSGGPPIFAKSGLGQGFEVFDDHISVKLGRYYRDARKTMSAFTKWLERDVGGAPFFAGIFLADLQFPKTSTANELGEERALSRESQVKEIDESLGMLMTQLRKLNRWDNTYVFLFGTNGVNKRDTQKRILGTNLHSDATQIAMMIKPARKARDAGIQWSIDANVSLVDVGITLYDLIGSKDAEFWERSISGTSLKEVLVRPTVGWEKTRSLVVESAWPQWRELGVLRSSARKSQWLYMFSGIPQVYNTLTDSQELRPLSFKDFSVREVQADIRTHLVGLGYPPWGEIPLEEISRITLLGKFRSKLDWTKELRLSLRHFVRSRPWDAQILGFLASLLIEKQDWPELKSLGELHFKPEWHYVASRMMGESLNPVSPCMELIIQKLDVNDYGPKCGDDLMLRLARWIRARGTGDEPAKEEEFLRAYKLAYIDQEISEINYQGGLTWDTKLSIPAGPLLSDLILMLPEFRRYRLKVEKQMERWKLN
jgi:hypothetical protein